MEILVNVVNQKLKIATNLRGFVEGTQNFVKFVFNFSDEWKSLGYASIFAQFIQNGTAYNAYLAQDYSCYLPPEIVAGDCSMLLYASDGTVKATTNAVVLTIDKNLLLADAQSTEITQSLYDQLVAKVNSVLSLSDSEYISYLLDGLEDLLAEYISDGTLANLTIEDGSITRDKVNSAFEATLAKADTAMQPSVYDTHNYHRDIFDFATSQDALIYNGSTGHLDVLKGEVQDAYYIYKHDSTPASSTNSDGDIYFTSLGNAIRGLYAAAKSYTDASFSTYSPFTVTIVDELPDVGAERTFYLIAKDSGNGYDKYWYIKDESNNYIWDNFGSTSTLIVESLDDVTDPSEDIDYIVETDAGYLYYKYIDGAWEMIAGSNSEVIATSYTIDYKGYGLPAENDYAAADNNNKYYLNLTDLKVYKSNGTSWVMTSDSPLSTASELTDYYLNDGSGSYVHYRYITDKYVAIGTSTAEMTALINTTISPIVTRLTTAEGAISTMQTALNNLSNMVKDVTISNNELTITYADNSTTTLEIETGIDIGAVRYNENEDYYLRFYDSNDNELEDLACYVPGGGGGGGGAAAGTAYITRITDSSVQSVYGDDCTIAYTFTATDASGDTVGNGVGTLYVNNVAVETGFDVYQGNNSINVKDHLVVGSNTVKISVSVDTGGESNTVATKTWSVNAINMYFTWNYADAQVNTSAVTDYYTPYGALSKVIYTFIDVDPLNFNPVIVEALPASTDEDFDAAANYFLYDSDDGTYTHYVWSSTNSDYVSGTGTLLDATTTTRSGVQQALTIPMQTHGSHAIVRYMIGTVNGTEIVTAQQTHDMIFVVSGTTTPVISTSFNTRTMTQYNTVSIPIVVYDPSNTTSTVILKENGTTVSTWTGVDRTVHYWNYSPTTYGEKTLTITCGATTKTLTISVTQLDIDEAEVTGYDFRFKASELATNSAAQSWSATTVAGDNVSVTYSNNFDWINGGLHTETDEAGHLRQYFCVRAGTTMTINYNLFGTAYDPKQFGKNFKFIFKAVNCRTYDAQVLSCMDTANGNNGVGLVMTANTATLSTANEQLDTYYYKDTYTEFETNIHPDSEYRYLQFWMDGSPDRTIIYSADDIMQQVTPVGITIGSDNCDVYIYMIKAYPTYMSNENELSNFIMDAPNAYEMVERYERNDVLNSSGEVDYTKLATANPDLHVLLLDLNRMSTGKKDNVVAYTVRHIYNAGGTSQCFTVNNACVTIQGTSSVGYLESAGNVDINFKNGRTFTSDNEDYTTGAISFDDGTSSTTGYALSENSIPVDYLNVKLNVASSENANNAVIADWYNTYQPWKSPARKKNAKARDTIEFVPGAIFIRDRSGNLFSDTTGYHLYGICDIGNSKKNTKVFHDTKNPLACCVEVANNTSLPCLMSSKVYTWNSKNEAVVTEDGEEQKVYEFRYVDDDRVDLAKAAWDRFVAFLHDHNPNLATGNNLAESVTFGPYTFKGSGSYNTSEFDSNTYDVIYLYGYGTAPSAGYSAATYVTDTSANATCYYYINYENDYIYSSNGNAWTAIKALTWTPDINNVLRGTSIDTYAGTYTQDTFNYRMAYLLAHCEEYMIMDPVIFHFVFIESFLMTDNVAKNTFWSSDDLIHWEPSKDYDNDTAIGNDNVGGLSFTYGLETDDTIGSSYVFNAHDAAWITFARNLFGACQTMYRNRESAGCFNTANFLKKMADWQATRPERVWVADAQRKYLRPYEDNGTETYIPMLAGRKTHQREQVKTYNAYYYASKYVSDFCTSQNIMVRGNTPTSGTSITVVPPANTATLSMYINCYVVITSTSNNVVAKVRGQRGQSYVMDFSTVGSMAETELYFCSAPMITELSGLAHLYFKQNNFGMATNLQTLEIGSNITGYSNPNLESLTIGNSTMLKYLDVRNCPNVTSALDLSGCVSLEEVYLENTSFTGITFAKSGLLKKAHLPTPTTLSMRDLIYLTDLTIASIGSLAQLVAENCTFASNAELKIGNTTTAQSTKDIILNLVESASNLSRVRLLGIDWALGTTATLDDLMEMAGIGDDGYATAQSVLTGEVYTPTMRQSLLTSYNTAWPYLTITYDAMVTQYLATFKNADGSNILDKNGNAYTQWVDAGGTPYDPITNGYTITISGAGTPADNSYAASSYSGDYYLNTTNGYIYLSDGTDWSVVDESDILLPKMDATAQYVYTYTGWDNISSAMTGPRTITAQYSTTTRTYTVIWYRTSGTVLETQTDIPYGSEAVYSGDTPTWTAGESSYIYRVFTGWDKSTGFVTGDMSVYAQWQVMNAAWPVVGTDMKDMTVAQIYGIAQSGQQSTYWEDKDYTDITLGHDYSFSNVPDIEIGPNQTISILDGTGRTVTRTSDYTLNGVTVDQYWSGGYYFNGSTAVTLDNIKLCENGGPAFTIAIDFDFANATANSTLVSTFDGETTEGFRLYYNTAPTLQWGDKSVTVGNGARRDIVVIRHPEGSNYLYVYAFGANTNDSYANTITKTTLLRSVTSNSDIGMTFGGVQYNSGYRYYGNGHIHWMKIWEADLGDDVAQKIATWPRELVRMEYWGAGKYYYYNSANTSKASFIANNCLRARGHYMNSTNTNSGGWMNCDMRVFCNGRLFDSLPQEWQSIIRAVEIKASAGSQSSTIWTSEDKVYLPSHREVGGSGTIYNDEIGTSNSPISWLTTNYARIKWRGRIRTSQATGTSSGTTNPDGCTMYVTDTDPAALNQKAMNPGDIWIHTGNSSIGYMFVPTNELTQYAITPAYNADSSYASGGWVQAYSWWGRSPYTGNSTYFMFVSGYGYPGSYSGASYTLAVALGFSI